MLARELALGTMDLLFGNGDVRVGRGKGIGPAGKHQPSGNVVRQSPTMRLASPQAHPQGRSGSTSAALRRRENNRIHRGPRDRNGSLGANVVGERHALPRSCTTFSGGRAFTLPDFPEYAPAVSSGVPGTLQRIAISETGWCPRVIEERRSAEISAQLNRSQQRTSDK